MKETIRNTFILLLYFCGFSKMRNFIFRLSGKSITRILAFHQIKTEQTQAFEKKLKYLVEHFNIITLKDFLKGNTSLAKINIVVTFDDGYRNWVDVIPLLEKYRIPAVFFVSSGFLGLQSEEEIQEFCRYKLKIQPTENLTPEHLVWIRIKGFEVGVHTKNHSDLGSIGIEHLREEIIESKKELEALLEQKVSYFAYPFGDFSNMSDEAIEIIKEAEYECALTIIPGVNNNLTNRYCLHRDSLESNMPDIIFRAWLLGNYDYLKVFINFLKNVRQSLLSVLVKDVLNNPKWNRKGAKTLCYLCVLRPFRYKE
ncbi:polysaccharide deacetylase family protein [bacterium]|nr:polysaccharide deacetylase family protein [bacterium]